MTKPSKASVFARMRTELQQFAASNSACGIDHDSQRAILLRMGHGDDMSLLEAFPGNFELQLSCGLGLDFEQLRNERDVEEALALCDAVVAGRGVSLSGPNGYPTRSWIFLDSRGFKNAVTSTAVSITSWRRARSIKKSLWQRKGLPVLVAETA